MAGPNNETHAMAVFCDFENIALGVREAKYPHFDMKHVLERLLLKGSIVVRKAYCDWDRYKEFKGAMHEAAFELIEIPHVRMSGKNSADIRMVVDALDLCYTKPHVDTFVIVSGDSDFSPLVAKLRENDKMVIGVGVKNSTSDLLTSACDEFIYYDDLVREEAQKKTRRRAPRGRGAGRETKEAKDSKESKESKESQDLPAALKNPGGAGEDERRQEALDLVIETVEALQSERGEQERVWGSMVKQALKRRKPGFRESYHGYGSFGELLEDAERRGLLKLERDERSGGHIIHLAGA